VSLAYGRGKCVTQGDCAFSRARSAVTGDLRSGRAGP